MKKVETSKLFFKKTTITKLNNQQLRKINGGDGDDDPRTKKPTAGDKG
ncbi:MAG: class I lanthipeptide [Emticicia sp.]